MPRPARSATNPAPASGLAWYTNADGIWPAAPRDTFAGAGAQHQVIFVAPSLDLIVVRNGDALGDTKSGFWGPVYELVVKPLMEAVTVQAPYPPSPVIRGAVFGKEIRRAAIDSDNWPLDVGRRRCAVHLVRRWIRVRALRGEESWGWDSRASPAAPAIIAARICARMASGPAAARKARRPAGY